MNFTTFTAPARRVALHVAVLLFSLLTAYPNCLAESLDELKGVSIEVRWRWRLTARDYGKEKYVTHYPGAILQIYISMNGNIFDRQIYLRTDGKSAEWFRSSPLGKATDAHPSKKMLDAWTFLNGHLTKVYSLASGFRTFMIAVDPLTLRCSFEAREEPDPQTGKILDYSAISGMMVETLNRTVASYTCEAKRGNIFAASE